MDTDDLYLADVRFFELVDPGVLPLDGTLERASGLTSDPGPYATSLIAGVETAWRTPYRDLTCEQVRKLLGQKMGLEQLAEPILRFVVLYPTSTVANYPGEMGLLTLKAATEFLAFAPLPFRDWLSGDFGWLDEAFGWSRSLRREAEQALSRARALAAAG